MLSMMAARTKAGIIRGCCGAARSSTFHTSRAVRTATTISRLVVTASSGFGWWCPPALAVDTLIPENPDP